MSGGTVAAKFFMTLAVCTPVSTGAWAYCYEPSAPSCASGYDRFQDEWEFSSCKSDMESYKSEIEDFATCKQREVEEANESARKAAEEAEEVARKARNAVEEVASDYSDTVRDFNSRAGN